MKEVKYTPAPWRIGTWGGHNANFIAAGPSNALEAQAICEVYGIPMHTSLEECEQMAQKPSPFSKRTLEGLANARLISSAPELLEALKSLVTGEGQTLKSSLVDKALAAINKVEGKA